MKFCMNCGFKLDGTPKFCPECGADLREAADHMKEVMKRSAEEEEQNGTSEPLGSAGFTGMGMLGMQGMLNHGRAFTYSTHGMAFNSGFTLRILEQDGKLTAMYRKSGVSEQNAKRFEVEDSFFERITEIINRYNGDSWDGFSEYAKDVFDGDSFSFSYSDGKERHISANGYMSWPDGIGGAIREIRDMYDEIYDRLWPDLYKIFSEYISTELVAKYGNSALGIVQGYFLGTVPYVHGNADGTYELGENPQPAGILGYGIFSGYEGKDEKNPGLRAVVVLAEKEKTDAVCKCHTNLKIHYYGLERGEEPKLLQEFTVRKEMVEGSQGEFRIFNFGTPDRMTVGIYEEHRFYSGEQMAYFSFDAFRLKKDCMEDLKAVEADVSRADGKMSEEAMNAICKKAEEAGMMFISIAWGNDWRQNGFIKVPLVSGPFGYSWYSVMDAEIPANPDGSLAGTAIPDWKVQVIRR